MVISTNSRTISETKMKCQTLIVLCYVVMSTADEDYENKLTKLWSMSGASNSDGSAVLNVTSASIVIQPSSYADASSSGIKALPYARYAFKPRAIPLRKEEQPKQKNAYYSQDDVNKYKSQILFPGNYYSISKEKSNVSQDPIPSQFRPKAIPLIRNEQFQRRSLDVDEEPIIEKPIGFSEPVASRRSISDMFGVDDDDDEEDEDDLEGEYEVEELDSKGSKNTKNKKRRKLNKYKMKKYMLPLLLAYKLKYFALVPVMIGGLVLLVGATGLAGFFFALFAAVMGLQKGGY